MMKSSIRARASAIVKKGFCFKASAKTTKDYGLIQSFEQTLKFNPKYEFTVIETLINNTDFHSKIIVKTSHPDLYVTPNAFILKPHTTYELPVTRIVQDQVLTALSDGVIADEKIIIDQIFVPNGTFVEDIKSIFCFKGKDYIVKKPKDCIDVRPFVPKTMLESRETDLRTVTVVISSFDHKSQLRPFDIQSYNTL